MGQAWKSRTPLLLMFCWLEIWPLLKLQERLENVHIATTFSLSVQEEGATRNCYYYPDFMYEETKAQRI